MTDPSRRSFLFLDQSAAKCSLLIFSGHLIPSVKRKHSFANTITLLAKAAVKRLVSEPYSSTDLILDENILNNLVFNGKDVVCHVGLGSASKLPSFSYTNVYIFTDAACCTDDAPRY